MLNELVQRVNKGFVIDKAWMDNGTELTHKTIDGKNFDSVYISGMGSKEESRITVYTRFKLDKEIVFSGVSAGQVTEKVATSEVSNYSFNSAKNVADDRNQDIGGSFEKAKYINGQIDRDSQPDNATHKDMTTFENDTDNAPRVYLKMVRQKNIGGIVWEDVDASGIREDNETTVIKGATVSLYRTSNMDAPEKTMVTNEQGRYLFENLSDGDYIVRFDYGNNDATVKLEGKGGNHAKSYNGHDFTSTTYMPGADKGSEARDNGDQRGIVNSYSSPITSAKATILTAPYNYPDNNEAIKELIDHTAMYAVTDVIVVGSSHDNKVRENTDFGLLEKPETNLKVEKQVASIVLKDNTGLERAKAIINENGEIQDGQIGAIKPISGENDRPFQYNIEMGEEVLEGATIEIVYNIIVKNEGNTTATVTKILDYFDNSGTFSSEYEMNKSWKILSEEDISKILDKQFAEDLRYNVVLGHEENIVLKPGDKTKKQVVLTSTLSSEAREIAFVNVAEIGEYIAEGRVDRDDIPANNKDARDIDKSENVTINSSTGEPRVYYMLGIVTLSILVLGIILIRKNVVTKSKKA